MNADKRRWNKKAVLIGVYPRSSAAKYQPSEFSSRPANRWSTAHAQFPEHDVSSSLWITPQPMFKAPQRMKRCWLCESIPESAGVRILGFNHAHHRSSAFRKFQLPRRSHCDFRFRNLGPINGGEAFFASNEPWTLSFEVTPSPGGPPGVAYQTTYTDARYTLGGLPVTLSGSIVVFYTDELRILPRRLHESTKDTYRIRRAVHGLDTRSGVHRGELSNNQHRLRSFWLRRGGGCSRIGPHRHHGGH